MKTVAEHEWKRFLTFYGKMFAGQSTRLGVFQNENGTMIDYWIEDGLPLIGIDMGTDNGQPKIEIMAGDLTHLITGVKKLTAYFPFDGSENGLDIVDIDGKITILRFEDDKTARRP